MKQTVIYQHFVPSGGFFVKRHIIRRREKLLAQPQRRKQLHFLCGKISHRQILYSFMILEKENSLRVCVSKLLNITQDHWLDFVIFSLNIAF